HRNWESYGDKISTISDRQRIILADPQTSGGLLVAVDADKAEEFENLAVNRKFSLRPFGKLVTKKENVIFVK
ncbi:MAG TPA: selenide, water dikinase SelD, partial [Cyclobacteriaceae bacterium]|nr:selenide, water dikinase SelD [Cyclobacteriaceae bacterium]